MSLILRKQCQDSLDKYGLDIYHVRIDERGKHLKIVGECGKPLVEVFGIRFTKITPSMGEIDYAEELFTEFLATHGKTIQEYIAKAKSFNKLKEIIAQTGPFDIDDSTTYNAKKGIHEITSYTLTINDGMMQFNYRTDKKGNRITFKSSNIRGNASATPEKATAFIADPALLVAGKKHIKAYINYTNQESDMEKLKEKLSKCDV